MATANDVLKLRDEYQKHLDKLDREGKITSKEYQDALTTETGFKNIQDRLYKDFPNDKNTDIFVSQEAADEAVRESRRDQELGREVKTNSSNPQADRIFGALASLAGAPAELANAQSKVLEEDKVYSKEYERARDKWNLSDADYRRKYKD